MLSNTLKLWAPILVLLLLFTAGCGGDSPTQAPRQAEKIQVVTTSNIIGDWVQAVGRDRVEVLSLLPADADPHTYQPGARDIARIADADLVVSVGLSLEARWLDKLIDNAAHDTDAVIELGDVVDPIDLAEIFSDHAEEGESEEEEEDDHGELDPHFWFDPLRVKQATNRIATQLSAVDPSGGTFYSENATEYAGELDDLHTWIQEAVATLPEEKRLLVTSHDTFQYFAVRYGFEVVGTIFPVTTETEPTAQKLSELIETIEHAGATAVFTERSQSDRMARRISEETGARLIGGLYTGSLGNPESGAGTYLDLMRHNTTIIVEALQ